MAKKYIISHFLLTIKPKKVYDERYLGLLSCHIVTLLIIAANNKGKKNMLFITVGSLDQRDSPSIGPAAFVALQHLLGLPALSLRSLSHHLSTSQWLLNQPTSSTITKGNITQWLLTYNASKSIATGKNTVFQNFDSIIFIYFNSFLKSPNFENMIFFMIDDNFIGWQFDKHSKTSPVNQAILFKCKQCLWLKIQITGNKCFSRYNWLKAFCPHII